jgi:hypothetical protein
MALDPAVETQGTHPFASVLDPWHFGTLHFTMVTLMRCATFDDWTDVMYINMFGECCGVAVQVFCGVGVWWCGGGGSVCVCVSLVGNRQTLYRRMKKLTVYRSSLCIEAHS